jgi:hypothetical protein
MKTKGELIKDIIKGLEEEARYKDIQDKFEKRSELEVSIGRIKQVVKEMEEKGEAHIERRVNESGNAITYVSSKNKK